MQYKTNIFYIGITLILFLIIGCQPSSTKINEYIIEKNYEYLFEYFQNATDKSISVTGYQEPTLFEKVMHSLVFSSSEYSTKTINSISTTNIDYALSLTKVAVDSNYQIPKGLHEIVYSAYNSQRNITIGKEEIEKLFKADTQFKPIIINDIIGSGNGSYNTVKISHLAELVSIDLPSEIINRINELPKEIAEIKKSERKDYSLASGLRSEKYQIERKINSLSNDTDYKVIKALMENSIIFEGYMVAYIDEIASGEVYEVRDMYSNLYLLNTVETRFTSKGFFKLRVNKSGLKIPMTIIDGGFKKDIPFISEVPSNVVSDYYANKSSYDELFAKLSKLEKEIKNKERSRSYSPEEYETQLQEKRTELANKKEELKLWIQNNIKNE